MIQFLLAAPNSGSGKTTLACALLAALKTGAELPPAPSSAGRTTSTPCSTGRCWGWKATTSTSSSPAPETARRPLRQRRGRATVPPYAREPWAFTMGLGGTSTTASAWQVADTLTSARAAGGAAQGGQPDPWRPRCKGLQSFRTPSHLAGILLNDCKPGLYKMLAPMLEAETGLPVAGFLPPVPEAAIGSRHLGLYTAGEVADLQQKIALLAQAAEENIHWEKLLSLCEQPAPAAAQIKQEHKKQCVKIAVARDEAFCFAYAETLEALTAAGAELVFFSPVRDPALPEGAGGLYLPGGYPELHAQALSENTSMRQSIRGAVASRPAHRGRVRRLPLPRPDAGRRGGAASGPWRASCPGREYKVGRLVRFGYATLTAQAGQPALPGRGTVPRARVPPLGFHGKWHGPHRLQGQWQAVGLRLCKRAFLCGVPAFVLGGYAPAGAVRGRGRILPEQTRQFMTEATLKTLLEGITPPDEAARAAAHAHWASLAKPLGGLGALETTLEDPPPPSPGARRWISPSRAVLVLCADNGVVAQGVSQTDQSVTRTVAENLAARRTSVCQMARTARCEVVPVDMGMAGEPVPGVRNCRVASGTADFTQGPAMRREQAVEAVAKGIALVREQKAQGVTLLATGEMGIGNTTTSSAVAAVLLGQPVERMTGPGRGPFG